MPQPKVLARGLLLLSLLVALLAAPGVFTSTLADEPAPQQSEAASSVVSLMAATGATPEYAGGGKLAALQPVFLHQDLTDIVISEFRFRSATNPDDEFIELYNPTETDIDVLGMSVWSSSQCVAAPVLVKDFVSSTSIPAWGHYLLGGPQFLGAWDSKYLTGISDEGGVALVNGPAVALDFSNITDQVGTEPQDVCPGPSNGYHEDTNLAPFRK